MRDFNPNSDSYPYASAMVGNKWVIMHMPDMSVHVDFEMPPAVRSRVCRMLNTNPDGILLSASGAIFDSAWDSFAAQEITRTELDGIMASITPR